MGEEKIEKKSGKGEGAVRDGKREERRNDLVGLSRTSFIFYPRLNIKDNLIIGGFSKASQLLLPPSSFLRASFYPFSRRPWAIS